MFHNKIFIIALTILVMGFLVYAKDTLAGAIAKEIASTDVKEMNVSPYPKESYKFKKKPKSLPTYKVESVLDGDTVLIRENKEDIYVRLIKIDCDETKPIYRAYKQAYETKRTIEDVIKSGIAAKDYLLDLVNENPTGYVDIEFFGLDKYGRKLGVLYKNNKNLNNEMLKSGFCAVFEYNTVNE